MVRVTILSLQLARAPHPARIILRATHHITDARTSPKISTPAPLEQATRLAVACWAEASTLAGETHAAIEAAGVQERKDKDTKIAELVADLDKTTTEKDTAAAEPAAMITDLEQQLTALGAELQDARTAQQGPNHYPPWFQQTRHSTMDSASIFQMRDATNSRKHFRQVSSFP